MSAEHVQLQEALALLKQEFPGAALYEVRYEERLGERGDHPDVTSMERQWRRTYWTVQVDNDHEGTDSLESAFADMRTSRERKAQIPSLAARVAAVLREISDEGFDRENVVMAARAILEKERGRR